MFQFKVGQRWISEAEPELGLGVITQVSMKMITCHFSTAELERQYSTKTAPLRRVTFSMGDEIKLQSGEQRLVISVEENETGVFSYHTQEGVVHESLLSDVISLTKPLERFFSGNMDSNEIFKLRYDVLLHQRRAFQSPLRGFQGARLRLIPHQFYVAQEVVKRPQVRVLLADEVGLGKTIEAGLILHQLILSGRIEKSLIIVPDSLLYQWFVEMLKKFQLIFKTINQETDLRDDDFSEGELFIVSLNFMMNQDRLREDILAQHWDMIVVDEAHQLKWSPKQSSPEYDFVSQLAKKSQHVLLLSGTPEILGLAGHFARLQLLDPSRFYDYQDFLKETSDYKTISDTAKKLLSGFELDQEEKDFLVNKLDHLQSFSGQEDVVNVVNRLIDLHGTGRVYFRNTRKNMEQFSESFPRRNLITHELVKKGAKKINDLKAQWVINFLTNSNREKTLLICHEKEVVLQLEKIIKKHTTAKISIFHSGMSLIQRDRQAAYFSENHGADILLTTEIGSEGRNFEFAHHLILFDLPFLPDLLEQRIGRLDRIGQKQNINIHVPYVASTKDEVLLRWYHEGLNAFESSPVGATETFMNVKKDLEKILGENDELSNIDPLIEKTQKIHHEIQKKLEDGQDKLIELNSYNDHQAMAFINSLRELDESQELKNLMLRIWNYLGVDVQDMNDEDTFFIKPSENMSIAHFPDLENDGMTVTFRRENALKFEKFVFLTWDHPMVLNIMDYISSKETGNMTCSVWKNKNKVSFLCEAFFVLRVISDRHLMAEKWFPPTPLRILLDGEMKNMTHQLTKKEIDQKTENCHQDLSSLPKDFLKRLLKEAKILCMPKAKHYKDKFIKDMEASLENDINRLEGLRLKNPTISKTDIEILRKNKNSLKSTMEKAGLSLDSLRIIVNK